MIHNGRYIKTSGKLGQLILREKRYNKGKPCIPYCRLKHKDAQGRPRPHLKKKQKPKSKSKQKNISKSKKKTRKKTQKTIAEIPVKNKTPRGKKRRKNYGKLEMSTPSFENA